MLKYILAISMALAVLNAASAADIEVKTKKDGTGTYIYYTGNTVAYDAKELVQIYDKAVADATKPNATPFLNTIVVNGPGGDGRAAIRLAEFIAEKKMTTVANGPCYSACSLMWMAGGIDNRYIFGNETKIGFHFAYTSNVSHWEQKQEEVGWLGVQDMIASSSHYYTAQLLRYGVKDPAVFLLNLATDGGYNRFYSITVNNVDKVVGGKVYEDVQS